MAIRWHWDQGREGYFDFDNLRLIAESLVDMDRRSLARTDADPLIELRSETGLPFATPPRDASYTIWRQYARFFRSALLATKVVDELAVTDVCRRLAGREGEQVDCDTYLLWVAKNFYCPSPAFETDHYQHRGRRVFPICAIVRYLAAMFGQNGSANLRMDDIFQVLIGNECSGNEPFEHYLRLTRTPYRPVGDDMRQVRELAKFISQFSFLSWRGGRIYFEPIGDSHSVLSAINDQFRPNERLRDTDRDFELISMGRLPYIAMPEKPISSLQPSLDDEDFTEGQRIRVTHLLAERNRQLRSAYFGRMIRQGQALICDFCHTDLRQRYPWTDLLLEIHHLLPLSSPAKIRGSNTSLDDLVPLCPNCHKSVHVFYRSWLKLSHLSDFRNRHQSREVYEQARTQFVQ
jgi:hypothetical protein